VIYAYFYESIFQEKSIHMVFTFFKLNNLKVIHDLYSQYLTQILSKTTLSVGTEGVLTLTPHLEHVRQVYLEERFFKTSHFNFVLSKTRGFHDFLRMHQYQ